MGLGAVGSREQPGEFLPQGQQTIGVKAGRALRGRVVPWSLLYGGRSLWPAPGPTGVCQTLNQNSHLLTARPVPTGKGDELVPG